MRITALNLAIALCIVFATDAGAEPLRLQPREPGISAHVIKLGGIIDQTGRGTVISRPILGGYKLAYQEINDRGGIYGRKIDYSALSDNYDASQTLPEAKQLVESNGVFSVAGIFGSDDSNAVIPYLEQKHVPLFDPIGGGADVRGKRWVWQTEPDYMREGRVIAKWVGSSLRAKRIGVLYQVGVGEGQLAALRKELPKYGASVVGVASYQSTDSNLSGQVLHLRSSNPDMVVLNGTPTPTAAFMQYASLLNFKPRHGFIANYPMSDVFWLDLIGSSGEGNYVCSYADITGHNATASAYRKAIASYHGEPYTNYGLYGYFNAGLLIRALKLAGRNPTRQRLQLVLDHDFQHYDSGFAGRINWSPGHHYGASQFKIYRIHNKRFVPLTNWLSP